MRKPVIAITPDIGSFGYDFGEVKFAGNTSYTSKANSNYIKEYGGVPIIPAVVEDDEQAMEIMEHRDGLFVTGGDDVNPALYGEEVMDCCGGLNHRRDKSDMALIKAAVALKKPILTFCRGSQITNVFFGGALYQDIKTQTGTDINHPALVMSIKNKDTDEQVHECIVEKNSPLYKLVGKETIRINSTHHQAVKTPGKNVIVQAKAPDGIVESWYLDSPDHYVRSYQWHPELQGKNPVKDAIAEDFIAACKERMLK